ncbi:MAG: DEAD/DEAH box helicase [Bacteroidales bacterium]
MIFEELNLNNPLFLALKELEFIYATDIQVKTFSPILAGNDVIGIAQTGTGKTLAYLLPILRQLKYSEQRQPRILILVPTRELVAQVCGEIEKLTKYMTVRFIGIYGGANINLQKQLVYDGQDIIVATPGRLMDLAMTGNLRLKSIQKLVIDEVDEMLNLGFLPQVTALMDILPKKRQNLMFSATLTPQVEEILKTFFNNHIKVEVAPHGTPIEKIEQIGFHVPNFYTKLNLLEYLTNADKSMQKVLVFVSTKKLADRLFEQYEKRLPGISDVMHSNKSQNYRFRVLEQFNNGSLKMLIATDIIARGLDIQDVTHVINFDIPDAPEDYIHRIGRTGRVDKPGIAISFINQAEKKEIDKIEQLMKKVIPVIPMPNEVVISTLILEEEKIPIQEKILVKAPSLKKSQGAFHQKSEKNKKVNSGSMAKKIMKKNQKNYR